MRLPERKFIASELLNDAVSGSEELMTADDYLQPNHWSEHQSMDKSAVMASIE
jgi:hypothetical protein